MSTAKSLTATDNFRPEISATFAGQISSLYFMSDEFMLLARNALRHSGFSQRGMIRYSVGMFCLGHALELTYKILLLKDGIKYPKSHGLAKLFGLMTPGTKNGIDSLLRDAGWKSCDDFHQFMAGNIDFVNRKYYQAHSSFDLWTHDQSGNNIDHKLWPQMVLLCERLHGYAASTIWIDPTLPLDG